MENYEHLKDQLCHIFSYGVSTICLVCKRIISGVTSPSSRQEHFLNHLGSSDHKESMRALFKMCISDPVCDINDGRYLDIVTKSTFDISVLLGEETCYICQKDDQLVCLMCRLSISEITSCFAQIKVRISQHLESAMHTNSVKEVCWYYRLNSKQDYLLFYKSIWHCSVCEETLESKETEVLQRAVRHVESNSHEARQHIKELNVGKEQINIGSEESGNNFLNYCDHLDISEQKGTLNLIKTEVVSEVMNYPVKVEPDEQIESYVRLHSKGEINTFERICSEIKDDQVKIPMQRPKKNMISLSSSNKSEQSSHKNQQCPSGNELVEEFLKDTCPFILKNRQFVSINGNTMFCTLCSKTIGMISDKKRKFERCLLSHIGGKEHAKNLNTLRDGQERIKTVHELFVKSDIEYFNVLLSNIKKPNSLKQLLLPKSCPVSSKSQSQSSKLQQEMYNWTSVKRLKAQDDICSHKCSGQNKVFGKCTICLRRMLKSVCPGMTCIVRVKNNTCLCCVCKKSITTTNITSLITSYFNHCESEAHKRCLKVYLVRKQKSKERREKRKE